MNQCNNEARIMRQLQRCRLQRSPTTDHRPPTNDQRPIRKSLSLPFSTHVPDRVSVCETVTAVRISHLTTQREGPRDEHPYQSKGPGLCRQYRRFTLTYHVMRTHRGKMMATVGKGINLCCARALARQEQSSTTKHGTGLPLRSSREQKEVVGRRAHVPDTK